MVEEEQTDEEALVELENAYTDCRETFIHDMVNEGRDEAYIMGRLEWLDEMYGDSLRTIQNILAELEDQEEGGEGCEI